MTKNIFVNLINKILGTITKGYMPRWTIFLIDEVIVLLSFLSLWLFRENISNEPTSYYALKFIFVLVIYATTALLFRTYYGVVRFSGTSDLIRVIGAGITGSAVYYIFILIFNDTIISDSYTSLRFNYWFPFVLGLMVIAGQLVFRFTVKAIFDKYISENSGVPKKNAFILGDDYSSVSLATQLLNDKSNAYKPVAYVSINGIPSGKRIGGLPIISITNDLMAAMERYETSKMLIFRNQLKEIPREFYDNCILEGLEVLVVNTFAKVNETTGQAIPQIDRIEIEDLLGRNAIKLDTKLIEDQFIDETILITGAAGSIGSELARQISELRCKEVIILDQAETPLNDLYLELSASKNDVAIRPIIANVASKVKMAQVFEVTKPSMVFHAAAYKHVPMMEFHPSAAIVSNLGGTKVVADLCLEHGVKRFVMISTDKAVNPTSVMGASKRAAEIYIQSLFLNQQKNGNDTTKFITTRFGNVLGSNGSVVPLFKKQIKAGGPVTVTHRDIIRYFMTIPEACSLVLEAGCTGHGGDIYIFDMGDAVKIYDLAEKMIRLAGKVPHHDIKIVEVGLRDGEKLYEELLATKENTLPTYHNKIMIAKVREYDYDTTIPLIEDIIETADKYIHPYEVVRKLKQLIPEYISQNSPKYELIDNELQRANTK